MSLFCIIVISFSHNNNHFVSQRNFLNVSKFLKSFYFIEKCLNDIALQMKVSISPSTTFIVHQAVPTHNQSHQCELIKASMYDLPLNQVLDPCLSGASIIIQIIDINQTNDDYPLTTVEDYFR